MSKRIFLTDDIYFDFKEGIYELYNSDFDNDNFFIKRIKNEKQYHEFGHGLELVTSIISRGVNIKELLNTKEYEFYGALSRKNNDSFETDFTSSDFSIGYLN